MRNQFGLTTAVDGKGVDRMAAGDELIAANIVDIGGSRGCSNDVAMVEMARAEGRKRHEMPEYLTWFTGTEWAQQRVNAAWKIGRKNNAKLRLRFGGSTREDTFEQGHQPPTAAPRRAALERMFGLHPFPSWPRS